MTLTLLQAVRNASRNLSSALALTAVLGLGANFVGVAPAQAHRLDTKDDATYTLKRVYKAGEIDRYRMVTKANVDNPQLGVHDIVSTMLLRDTTKEVKADGASTSISDFESASLITDGVDQDITSVLPKVITKRDKDGKTDVKLEGGDPAIIEVMGDQVKQLTLASASAFLPSKPIKVGDSWDMDPAGAGPQDGKIKAKVTLMSVDTIKGVKIARLKTIRDVTGEMNTKMHSEAITLLDMVTGKPLSVSTKTEGESAGGKLSIEMTLKMLGPDDKGDPKEAAKPNSAVKKP